MKKISLTSIEKLPSTDVKKYQANFLVDGKMKKVKFGANGYSDYTIHKDATRRSLYIDRHKKDLKTNDPSRAGYLSMFILWNKPNLTDSIKDYKDRLNKYNETGVFPKEI